MRFKMDRLCELAGVPFSSRRGKLLRENKKEKHTDHDAVEEGMYEEDQDESMDEADEDEDMKKEYFGEEIHEDDDEVIEIDEKELVQELRRAKRIMQEGKRKAVIKRRRRKNALQEAELKAVIDQEVKNVIKEMDLNLNSSWIYGKNKPTRSKKGYTHQGSYLKGIGFK
jgi:hypothetical protein